jgi:hypothetical protein
MECRLYRLKSGTINPAVSCIPMTILSNVEADENYNRRWIFSDESTFHVSGRVNTVITAVYGE